MDHINEPIEFNQFIGTETINREYKEFTFNSTGLDLDTQLAEKYCMNNKFEFNTNVLRGIDKYLKDYLPKYVCGFINAKIDGTFWIGINDFGFVKGIPYQGTLSKDIIEHKVRRYLSDRVQFKETFSSGLYQKFIKINLINIENPKIPDDVVHPKFKKYLQEKEKYLIKYNEFLEKTESWKIRFAYVNQKLVDLVNNTESRNMILDYIRKKDPANSVIDLLESEYKMETKTHEEICILRETSDNPYYWVCLWKDEMIDYVRAQRPTFTEDFNDSIPCNLITSAYDMIPYWTTYNDNMKLYVIQIQILFSEFQKLCHKILTSILVSYIDKNKRLLSCLRIVLPNGDPICIPKDLVRYN